MLTATTAQGALDLGLMLTNPPPVVPSSMPPHTHRVPCCPWCPCSSHAACCLLLATRCDSRNSDGDEEAVDRPSTDLSAELAALEHWELNAINEVSRSERSWSLDQIATYYTCCKLHGVGSVDSMYQHLGGTKSKDQIRRYSSDWTAKAGTILRHVDSYRPGGPRPAEPARMPKTTRAASPAHVEKIGDFAFAEFAEPVQEEPFRMALDDDQVAEPFALTESEQLGLLAISASAKTWNTEQITCYYRGLKLHGPDFQAISREVPGKSLSDAVNYFHNWNRNKPPMQEYLQNFKATQSHACMHARSAFTGARHPQNATVSALKTVPQPRHCFGPFLTRFSVICPPPPPPPPPPPRAPARSTHARSGRALRSAHVSLADWC